MNNYNINAAVANTGNGNVSTGNVTANNFQFNPSEQLRTQMNDIVAKLENVLRDNENTDINEALATLKEETTKTSWSQKTIKMTLNAIKGIASGVVANQITPIVTQGLSLLM